MCYVFEDCMKYQSYLVESVLVYDLNLEEFHQKVSCNLIDACYQGFLRQLFLSLSL